MTTGRDGLLPAGAWQGGHAPAVGESLLTGRIPPQ